MAPALRLFRADNVLQLDRVGLGVAPLPKLIYEQNFFAWPALAHVQGPFAEPTEGVAGRIAEFELEAVRSLAAVIKDESEAGRRVEQKS